MTLPIFSLEGKSILITGASSGIGRAVAQQCAASGASCIITGRDHARLTEVLATLPGEGHRSVICDLTQSEELRVMEEALPELDGVVCCAGIVETRLIRFSDDEELVRLFETNAFSSIRLVRDLVQGKNLLRGASIVLVSSISGVRCAYLGGSVYGATKGAIEGFAKAAALELAARHIRVNTIMPGMVATALMERSSIDSEQLKQDIMKYPLKRYGTPEEVGYAAVYLLSDATRWMTGTSLLLDGGYTLQ